MISLQSWTMWEDLIWFSGLNGLDYSLVNNSYIKIDPSSVHVGARGGRRAMFSDVIIKYLLINLFLLFFSFEQEIWTYSTGLDSDLFQVWWFVSQTTFNWSWLDLDSLCVWGRLHSVDTHKEAFSQVWTLSCFQALDIHLGSSCFTAARAIKSHNSEMMANKVELFGHLNVCISTVLCPVFIPK